ncbi:hypothetical protein BJ742DRAFT_816847 [Cladochytrium replicatum]|nr:hypothetical protein BJ742DRAFT_816847 [Cladochytrium replicatum]
MSEGENESSPTDILTASTHKASLIANPWDHGGISSPLDIPRTERPSSKLDQLNLLAPMNSRPLLAHEPPLSPLGSTSAVDYLSVSPNFSSLKRASFHDDPWAALRQHFIGKDLLSAPNTEIMGQKMFSPRPSISGFAADESDKLNSPSDIQWFLDLDHIKVDVAPEKGGYIIKFVNYIVQSSALNSTVLRRYSDFLWLCEILHKRYPYRLVPPLPPKKVNELDVTTADEIFIEGRRRGLARFLHLVANHPILRKDDIVIFFLTEKTEIKEWRKLNTPSCDEELVVRTITAEDMAVVPGEIDQMASELRKRVEISLAHYRDMSTLMDREATRQKETAADFLRYSMNLQEMVGHSDCIGVECFNCPLINEGYQHISNGFRQHGLAANERHVAMTDNFVENLKSHRDLLDALLSFLDRRERTLSSISIDALNRRIHSNLLRIEEAKSRGNIKELERLQQFNAQDENELQHHNQRLQFLRLCTWEEMRTYHQQRAFVSTMYQQFVSEQQRVIAQQGDIWKSLSRNVYDLPTSGFL